MAAVSIALPQEIETRTPQTEIREADLSAIILRHGEIPTAVVKAGISHRLDRVLSPALFDAIIAQPKVGGSDEAWAKRLYRRRVRLKRFVGRRLVCAFIRVPGAHHTIEIDPDSQNVVHWEAQAL